MNGATKSNLLHSFCHFVEDLQHVLLRSAHVVQNSITTVRRWDYARSSPACNDTSALLRSHEEDVTSYHIRRYAGPVAATNARLVQCVSHIFNESFGFRPDGGRPYRLGRSLAARRLSHTDVLLVAGDEHSGVGYLYGKEIPYPGGKIVWIESMAVLPIYRCKGIGTALVKRFLSEMEKCYRLGCATPNPIAAYVVTRALPGTTYIGRGWKPSDFQVMIREVQSVSSDMKGCPLDAENFRIKTGFSPQSTYDHRSWEPREPQEEPSWWTTIQCLPHEFEALVIVERPVPLLTTSPETLQAQASAPLSLS